MNCPKCGKENKDDAQLCEFCESPLTQTSTIEEKVEVRISRFAIGSLICGFLSLILLLLAMTLENSTLIIIDLGVVIAAVLLGLIGLTQIAASGGKIVGKGLAVIGIGTPTILFFILFIPTIFFRPRCVAFRMTCGTNLSSIGKAILIYANDYEDEFPRAGGRSSIWGAPVNWTAADRRNAYSLSQDGTGGKATISSSLYLLVKYSEIKPKTFICVTGEPKATEFKPAEYSVYDKELIYLWDFGPEPQKHCSYSYHIPYGQYALTTSGDPGMAVAADRNPWIDSPFYKAKDFSRYKPDISPWNGTPEEARAGNTYLHINDGQQVLFLDSHVSFEKRPFCGVNDDNIYTSWDGQDRIRGVPPVLGSQPADKLDSLLVNDPWIVSEKPRRVR